MTLDATITPQPGDFVGLVLATAGNETLARGPNWYRISASTLANGIQWDGGHWPEPEPAPAWGPLTPRAPAWGPSAPQPWQTMAIAPAVGQLPAAREGGWYQFRYFHGWTADGAETPLAVSARVWAAAPLRPEQRDLRLVRSESDPDVAASAGKPLVVSASVDDFGLSKLAGQAAPPQLERAPEMMPRCTPFLTPAAQQRPNLSTLPTPPPCDYYRGRRDAA